jgi:hypothetical protein
VPFRTAYDPSRRLFLVTPDGDCRFSDGLTMLRDLAADPRRAGCAGILADTRGLAYLASHVEVQALAAGIAALGALPFAVVAAGGARRGVANQLAGYAGLLGGRVHVFGDVAAAAWLAGGGNPR